MEIIVDKVSYTIPERLTVDQWCQVMQYDFKLEMNWPTIIHIITGVPKQLLIQGSRDTLELGASIIVELCNRRQPTKIKPMDTLTFGEFVDLDSLIALGSQKHLTEMAKILCDTEWADEALWALDQWAQYRTWIFRQYAALFGLDEDDALEDYDTPKDPSSVARNWYKIIVDLANDDILRLDDVTDQPLVKTLNFMALRKERQLEENMKIMEQNMKLKTQR